MQINVKAEDMPESRPTISKKNVAETLLLFEQQGLKPEVMRVIYEFASEITGEDIDCLDKWVDIVSRSH